MNQLLQHQQSPERWRNKSRIAPVVYACCLVALLCGAAIFRAITIPHQNSLAIRIEAGMTAEDIANHLYAEGYVRSAFAMRVAFSATGKSASIHAGSYTLPSDSLQTVFGLAEAIVAHDPAYDAVFVTFPEGVRGADILERMRHETTWGAFATATPALFDEHIGFLFPDTYAIDSRDTPETLVARMQARYEEQLAPLREKIAASDFSEREVIILASLLEKEANSEQSMRRVSGILHNRLKQGMRLQLDAPLAYLLGKTSAELTEKDLAFDSPYNTYRVTGLTPAPIANPGIVAIRAVLEPIPSEDLFYLTAPDGTFHYAKTFSEHVKNKEKYLP